MNEKIKKDLEIVIVLLFFAFIFTAYGPYSGMLASLGIGSGVVYRPAEQPLLPSTLPDQAQNNLVTAEDIIASLGVGASNIAEQSLPPSVQKELGLLKKLGLEEKTLEGEVMTAIIDLKNNTRGEVTETHFFDTLNKTFYRVDDSFKDLDNKRGKKLKIKARVKGNTIENADILAEQNIYNSAFLGFGSSPPSGETVFKQCTLPTFPGWPDIGPWLVLSTQANASVAVGTQETSSILGGPPATTDNSTLMRLGPGTPFTGPGGRSVPWKTLIIAVDFLDSNVKNSDSEIRDMYFKSAAVTSPDQSVKSFYQHASRAKVTFSGDFVRVHVPMKLSSYTTCSTELQKTDTYLYWGSSALFEADKKGFKEANYDLVSFIFPDNNPCRTFGDGIAFFDAKFSFIFAPPSGNLIAHEIGHNFNLKHAASVGDTYGNFMYGDPTDIMGRDDFGVGGDLGSVNPVVYFNSAHTIGLNWYPHDMTTKDTGVYRIAPLSKANTSEPKIILINNLFPWLVSYRVYDGLDANLHAPRGVYLHAWNPSGNCSLLIDREIRVGETSVSKNIITGGTAEIEVLYTDEDFAYVRITSMPYGGEPYVRITDPPAGKETLARNDFPIKLEAADDVDVSKVDIYLDQPDTGAVVARSISSAPSTTYFQDSIINGDLRSASLGPHNLIAKVTDNDGKTSLSDLVSILVTNTPTDNISPIVTLVTDPPNGGVTEGGISVSVDATDNVAIESLKVLVNNALAPEPGSCNPNWYIRKPPFTIQCGLYLLGFTPGSTVTVDVTAVDTTGNTTKKTSTLTYTPNPDTEPPQLTITKPSNGAIVQPNTIVPITFTLSDNKAAWAYVYLDETGMTTCPNNTYATTGPLKTFTCNWTVPNLPGTTHYISVRAYDGIGTHEVRKRVAVGIGVAPTIDTEPPAIIFSSPTADSTVTGTAVPVKLNTYDTSAIREVYVKELNGTILKWFGASPFEFTYNANAPTLRPGPHTIYATAEDIAGNLARQDLTFNIKDIRLPSSVTLSLTAPPAINYKRGTLNILAKAYDDDKVSKIEHYLDGTLVYSSSAVPFSIYPYTTTWAWNTDLAAQGAHQLYAKAYDPTGNVGTSPTYTVFVDRTAPAATVSVAPVSGGTVSGSVTLTAVPSDTVGVIKNVLFYQDASYVGTASAAPYTAVVDTTKLSNGSHTFKARAYDMTLNYSAFATVTVTVANGDTTPPSVTLTSPLNGAFVGSNGTTLSATASDTNGILKVEFLVDGVIVGTDTASPYSMFWSTASVVAGTTHTIRARAYDKYNNVSTSALVTVTVEKTPPTVALTSPLPGAVLAGAVTLSATASDASGISKVEFYANGVLKGTSFAAASPYTFNWNTTLVPNGTYSLTAKAYDKAGNTTVSATVSVTVANPDTTPPTVAFISPAEGATISGIVTLSASATDHNRVTQVTFRRSRYLIGSDTTSPYSVSWDTRSFANGTYTITAYAYDEAGNMGTAQRSVAVSN